MHSYKMFAPKTTGKDLTNLIVSAVDKEVLALLNFGFIGPFNYILRKAFTESDFSKP